MELEESDGPFRSNDSSRRHNRSFHQRSYESDYDDQHFPSSSSGRYRSEYRSGRERHTAPALENRRKMFEREQQQRSGGRHWEPEYSDSYSDIEFKRHRHPNESSRDRARERERERVTEYRKFFQQKSQRPDDFRSTKPSMKRQDSSTSHDSSYNRHYPEGLFDVYRSRFEVNTFRISYNLTNLKYFLFSKKSRTGRDTSSEKSNPNSRGGSVTGFDPPAPPVEARRVLTSQSSVFDPRSPVEDPTPRRSKSIPAPEATNFQSPAVRLDFLIQVISS